MPASFQTPEQKAFSDILKWSEDQPAWQRDALRRLCQKPPLDESDHSELFTTCKDPTSDHELLKEEHLPKLSGVTGTVTLAAVHDTKNVNALAAGQRLTFCKSGLTVIYGDNGSGKSGYIRILKRACRARIAKKQKGNDVLSNVYAQATGQPEAKIDFTVGGQNQTHHWMTGHDSDAQLSAISVFDSRTANVHVDETNDVAYTPYPLRLMGELAALATSLKKKLKDEQNALEVAFPSWVASPKVGTETMIGKFLSSISKDTKDSKVRTLGKFSEIHQNELNDLNLALASTPQALIAKADKTSQKIGELSALIKNISLGLSDEVKNKLIAQVEAMNKTAIAERLASTKSFEDEPIKYVGGEAWKILWEAARTFSTKDAYPDAQFPKTDADAKCVLCQQDISESAANRLRRFEEFVKGEVKVKADQAKSAYEKTISDITFLRTSRDVVVAFTELLKSQPDMSVVSEQFRRFIILSNWRVRQMLRIKIPSALITDLPASHKLLESLNTLVKTLEDEISLLGSSEREIARAALISSRDELVAKKWLSENVDDVVKQVGRLKEISTLKTAEKRTQTNRITQKSTEIAKALVTDALRAEFSNEVNAFGIADREIELRQAGSSQGVPQFKVSLIRKQDAHVGNVLSEGEYRCAALAAFLAELTTSNEKSAIVFDDPVSSLDHMHREKVAMRLVREAEQRQVVVFTHDIAFLFYLEHSRRNTQVQFTVRSIGRGDRESGFCNEEPPVQARSVDQTISAIQKQLDNQKIQHERGQQSDWSISIANFSDQLRKAWEKAVEETVTPVIKRLSNKVYTDGLIKLTVLTEADVKEMRDAFGRCSKLKHSDADILNPPLPTPQNIQDEIDSLKTWSTSVRGRQSSAKLS